MRMFDMELRFMGKFDDWSDVPLKPHKQLGAVIVVEGEIHINNRSCWIWITDPEKKEKLQCLVQ